MATLYAQPTKEWVIPAKPKPGRKPKRDDPVVDEDTSGDSKAKKVQNRAAQRAFRERKQSQLADLQARLTQYEQGEIERNVALQNIAKKLKEDNERLKSENDMLREEGDRVREENLSMRNRLRELQEEFSAYRRKMEPNSTHFDLESTIATRKRPRTDSDTTPASASTPGSSSSSTVAPTAKRKHSKEDNRSSTPAAVTKSTTTTGSRLGSNKGYSTLPPDYAPPPQLVHIYSPATSAGSSRPSLVMSTGTSENSAGPEPVSLDDTLDDDSDDDLMSDYTSDKLPASGFDVTNSANDLDVIDCGFCSKDSGSCVCREVSFGINQLLESTSSSAPTETSLLDPIPSTSAGAATSSTRTTSILDNLPPVQPGVPLRLRRSKRTNDGGPVHLTPVPQLLKPASRPVCSGDPSNCEACADDPFGRAFCRALANGWVCRDPNCKRCPKSKSDESDNKGKGKSKAILMDVDIGVGVGVGAGTGSALGMGMNMETGMLLCCGDPKLCGGGVCGVRAPPSSSSSSPSKPPQRPSLLTASSGSSIQLPQSHTRSDIEDGSIRLPPIVSDGDNEIPTNDAWEKLKSHPNIAFADLSLLADVVAGRTKCTGPRVSLSPMPEDAGRVGEEENEKQDGAHPHPTLVPQEALVRCGRERLMRVQAEGVRDALAMLDVQRP